MTPGAPPVAGAGARPAPRPRHVSDLRRAGVLIVDKPAGVTSHDVIDVVRRRFRDRGAGHLGTLDPAATGLLAVALGAATRCIPVWQGGAKTYVGTVRLGVTTSTQDTTGDVVLERPVCADEAALREASRAFVGDLEQIPPMVSALRVRGERLYRLARRGVVVERAPRPIRVTEWEWLSFDLPLATFRVRCSSGTYVRTLAHDLGERLGCGAALHVLRRLRSEPFDLARSTTVRELYELPADAVWDRAAVPLGAALDVLPGVALDDAGTRALGHGRAVVVDEARVPAAAIGGGPRSVALRAVDGTPIGLGDVVREGAELRARPHVVFPWATAAESAP